MRGEADNINETEYLEYIIDTYQNLIYSICYKMTNNYFDAEDVAQDTFLSAYKNFPSFDRTNEKAWLCKIATNKCLDFLKRAGNRLIPTDDEYFKAIPTQGNSPEETYLEEDVKRQLFYHCNQLKAPYKEVAISYFYYELDINDIAEHTGKNTKTLQTQIYRAKAMLRKLYRKGAIS